jgi:hypothetical protein
MPVELLVALGFAVLGQTTYSSSPGNTTRRSSRVFNALFRVHADGTAICSVRKDELYAYAVLLPVVSENSTGVEPHY